MLYESSNICVICDIQDGVADIPLMEKHPALGEVGTVVYSTIYHGFLYMSTVVFSPDFWTINSYWEIPISEHLMAEANNWKSQLGGDSIGRVAGTNRCFLKPRGNVQRNEVFHNAGMNIFQIGMDLTKPAKTGPILKVS